MMLTLVVNVRRLRQVGGVFHTCGAPSAVQRQHYYYYYDHDYDYYHYYY